MTAIIDGMGSIGAAIGPMMTGYISGEVLRSRATQPCGGAAARHIRAQVRLPRLVSLGQRRTLCDVLCTLPCQQ